VCSPENIGVCVHACMPACICVCVSNRPGLLEFQLNQVDIFVSVVRWFLIFEFFHLSLSTSVDI